MRSLRDIQFNSAAALRLFCAALLLSLGLAHRPVVAAHLLFPDHHSEEYRLPDGSFADICLESHTDSQEDQHPHGVLLGLCEACILAGAIILPVANDDGSFTRRIADCHHSIGQTATRIKPIEYKAYFARGPPVYTLDSTQ